MPTSDKTFTISCCFFVSFETVSASFSVSIQSRTILRVASPVRRCASTFLNKIPFSDISSSKFVLFFSLQSLIIVSAFTNLFFSCKYSKTLISSAFNVSVLYSLLLAYKTLTFIDIPNGRNILQESK